MQDPSAFQPMKPQFPEQERLKCPRCESTNTKFCYYNNYNLSQPRHFCKNCRRYWTKGGALRNIPVGGGTRKNAKRPNAANNNDNSSNNDKRPGPGSEPEPEQKHGQGASLDSSHTPPPPSAVAPASQPRPSTNGVDPTRSYFPDLDPTRVPGMGVGSESFSSLLASNMQFGGILEGLHSTGSGLKMVQLGGLGVGGNLNSGSAMNSVMGSGPELGLNAAENNSGSESESYLSLQNGGDSSCWGNSNAWPNLAIYTPGSRFQ